MRRAPASHPDQLQTSWPDEDEIERIVEERMAQRFESESFLWRFRLVSIETILLGALVLIAGLLLKQPTMMVVHASALIAASCFATGFLMILLSAWTSRMMARLRAWRQR